jgi:hypothetical protein
MSIRNTTTIDYIKITIHIVNNKIHWHTQFLWKYHKTLIGYQCNMFFQLEELEHWFLEEEDCYQILVVHLQPMDKRREFFYRIDLHNPIHNEHQKYHNYRLYKDYYPYCEQQDPLGHTIPLEILHLRVTLSV